MQDLRLIGVQEGSQHLMLAGPDGTRYRLPIDDALRAASRRDGTRGGRLPIEIDSGLRPRDIQAMIRAGANAAEVAERTGWLVEKVERFEGPILAERIHVATLAREVRMRPRAGRGGTTGSPAETLAGRVSTRLTQRGIDPHAATWDAWRLDNGPGHPVSGHWTVGVTFAAGGRTRQATWTFDPQDRTVDPTDDEARWLSEDLPAPTGETGPIPTSAGSATAGDAWPDAPVYDQEAHPGAGSAARPDEPADLMVAMRERRSRRATRRRREASEFELPLEGMHPHAETGESAIADPGQPWPAVEPQPDGPQPDGPEPGKPDTVPIPQADSDDPTTGPETGPETGPPVRPERNASSTPEPTAGLSAAPRRSAKSRPSVPRWDDIMFGSSRD